MEDISKVNVLLAEQKSGSDLFLYSSQILVNSYNHRTDVRQ